MWVKDFCSVNMGASTVKWTTLDPCLGLSESDSKLYTNFEFYEIEIHKYLENIWIYKAKWIMFTKNNFKQRICILEDGASGEQMGDIEKIIVIIVMKIMFKTIFSRLLLRITIDDRFWRSHIDIIYLST